MNNAPTRKGEGVACRLPASDDANAYITAAARAQFLARLGLPAARAVLLAPLAFGEARP